MQFYQKGETIVEVLLSIVVIATALGGAFAIANRSSNTMQDSKEQYQAQLYLNGQADYLKAYAGINKANLDTNFLYTRVPFCMVDGAPVPVTGEYDVPPCDITNGGAIYSISISSAYDNTSAETKAATRDVYVITITWPSIIQGTTSKVEMVYAI